MPERLAQLRKRFEDLEQEFEETLAERRRALKYSLDGGRAIFKKEALKHHHALKKSAMQTFADARLRNILASPFIYAVVLPVILLDIFATVYQHVGFRLWRIPRITRSDYVVMDHHRLGYLNWIQKINCLYCSYTNGVLAYVSEVASLTEQFWCPIKHAIRVKNPHNRYYSFIDYGDGEDLAGKILELRERLRLEQSDKPDPSH